MDAAGEMTLHSRERAAQATRNAKPV